MAMIKRHPRWATFVGCALVVLALWALLPSPFVKEALAQGGTDGAADAAEGAARRHRSYEHTLIQRMPLHADAIAEERAA